MSDYNYTREDARAEVRRKRQAILDVIAHELPSDPTAEDVYFALITGQNALFTAVEQNVAALCDSNMAHPAAKSVLVAATRVLRETVIKAIRDQVGNLVD